METVPSSSQQQVLTVVASIHHSQHDQVSPVTITQPKKNAVPAEEIVSLQDQDNVNSGSPYGSQLSVRIEQERSYCCSSLCQIMSSMGDQCSAGCRTISQRLANCWSSICCTRKNASAESAGLNQAVL